MKRSINLLGIALFCIYLHFFYYVLLVPAFTEFSFYGFLVVPLGIVGFWLVPKQDRKKAAVLTLLFIFMEQAFANIITMKPLPLSISVVIIIGFLYLLMRWYARFRLSDIAVIALIALAFNLIIPARLMLAIPEFYPRWISEPQYLGEFQMSLPLAVADLDGDGKDEIIVLGNRDYYPDGQRKLPQTYQLYEEPLRVMAWTWDGSTMVRMDDERVEGLLGSYPNESRVFYLSEWIANQRLGFPYYTLNEHLEIEPLVERKSLTEGMLQFGTAPYRVLQLNMEQIMRHLDNNGGIYDQMAQGRQFSEVVIRGGRIEGWYRGEPFSTETTATQIIGAARLQNGEDALVVKGMHLELMQVIDGELVVTHTLTREMQRDLSYSSIMIDDVNGDGADEIIIAYPYTSILSPEADGTWNLLWGTHRSSFHVKAIGPLTAGVDREMLALSKSRVRASDAAYLTSFTYTDQGLKQNWKIFSRNLNTVALADIQGTGQNDLVVTFGGSSAIYVLAKHNIPVTTITIVLTVLLYVGLIGRRILNAKQTSPSA